MTGKRQTIMCLVAVLGVLLVARTAAAEEERGGAEAREMRLNSLLDTLTLNTDELNTMLGHVRGVRTAFERWKNTMDEFRVAAEQGRDIWGERYEQYRRQTALDEKVLFTAFDDALEYAGGVLDGQDKSTVHRYLVDEMWYNRFVTAESSVARPAPELTMYEPDPDADITAHCSEQELREMYSAFLERESEGVKVDRSEASAPCLKEVPTPVPVPEKPAVQVIATVDARWEPQEEVSAKPPWHHMTDWPEATTDTIQHMLGNEQSLPVRQFFFVEVAKTVEKVILERLESGGP
jgi:hypothetical protein